MILNSPLAFTVVNRFLKYVTIDTQSDPSSETFPSTEKQKDLCSITLRRRWLIEIDMQIVIAHGSSVA